MPETYTEVTRRSWGSRLRGAFKGILFGFLLVALGLWLLFWNEGRAVRRHKALVEGGGAVVSVAWDRIDPANEGKLVHVTGPADTDEVLRDAEFGIAVNAIHLSRKVEMFQWQQSSRAETRKKLGGGTETTTTYAYSTGWSGREISSSSFKQPEGHFNPPMPYGDKTVSASEVFLGAFELPKSLVDRISGYEPLEVRSLDVLPGDLRYGAHLAQGGFYIGYDPSSPEVGDLRVSFRYVEPTIVSVVAVQSGDTFSPYRARTGTVELLRRGTVSAEEMFESAESANRTMSWVLRFVGFLVIWFGLKTIIRPLSVMADVLPALGNIAEKASSVFAAFLAGFLALLTIAFSWLFHRPLLGLAVLLLAAAAGVGVVRLIRRARRRAAAPAARPAPPPPPPPGV